MTKKPPAERVAVRRADENNQVVSLKGGSDSRTKICTDCPWRLDAEPGAFPAEAFRISAHVSYDQAFSKFACHTSGTEHPQTCVGFLLRGAAHNIAVRISGIDLDALDDDGAELYESYRAMAVANGVDPDDPVLARCRD